VVGLGDHHAEADDVGVADRRRLRHGPAAEGRRELRPAQFGAGDLAGAGVEDGGVGEGVLAAGGIARVHAQPVAVAVAARLHDEAFGIGSGCAVEGPPHRREAAVEVEPYFAGEPQRLAAPLDARIRHAAHHGVVGDAPGRGVGEQVRKYGGSHDEGEAGERQRHDGEGQPRTLSSRDRGCHHGGESIAATAGQPCGQGQRHEAGDAARRTLAALTGPSSR